MSAPNTDPNSPYAYSANRPDDQPPLVTQLSMNDDRKADGCCHGCASCCNVCCHCAVTCVLCLACLSYLTCFRLQGAAKVGWGVGPNRNSLTSGRVLFLLQGLLRRLQMVRRAWLMGCCDVLGFSLACAGVGVGK